MRKFQKLGAAMIVAAVMASGIGSTVHASGGATAAQKTALCAAIESAETQLSASTNPYVVKYLTALLAGLEKLEALLGGCGE